MPATALASKVRLYKETLGLVNAFYKNSSFKQAFRTALLSGKKNYLGTPLGSHIWVLSKIDRNYRGLLQEYKGFLRGDVEPEKFVDEFFNSFKEFYEDRLARQELESDVEKYETGQINHPGFVSPEEHGQLVEAENLPFEPARTAAYENFMGLGGHGSSGQIIRQIPRVPVQGPEPTATTSSTTEVKESTTIRSNLNQAQQSPPPAAQSFSQPSTTSSSEGFTQTQTTTNLAPQKLETPPQTHPDITTKSRTSNLFQRLGGGLKKLRPPQGLTLPIGKFIRKNVTVTKLLSILGSGIGAITGYSMTGTPLGALGGGTLGGLLPSWIQKAGSNGVLKAARKAANSSADFVSGVSNRGGFIREGVSKGSKGFTGKRLAWLFLFVIFGGSLISLFGFTPPPKSNLDNLTIKKSGPADSENGRDIPYTITITYTGSGQANIEVTDQLDLTKVEPVSVSDGGALNGSAIKWNLTNILPNQPKTLSLTVRPLAGIVNFWLVNQAEAKATPLRAETPPGGTGPVGPSRGLLCVAGLDSRLTNFFENAGVNANVSPSLLYAIAKAENGGAVSPWSVDGRLHAISPCGAHGLMQIQHINDGSGRNYSTSCVAIGGSPSPPEIWDGLSSRFNSTSGGKLTDADNDEHSIFGAAYYIKERATMISGRNYQEALSEAELRAISKLYLGATNGPYADQYVNSYRNAFAAQGTCGGTP